MSEEIGFYYYYNYKKSAIELAADSLEERELFNKLSKYFDEADGLAKELD